MNKKIYLKASNNNGFTAEINGLDKLLLALDPNLTKKTTSRTLNDLMKIGSNVAVRKVVGKYNLPTKKFKSYTTVSNSTVKTLEANISIKRSYIGLFNFINKSSLKSSLKTRKNTIKVKILKGGRSHTFRHAFLMIGKNGNKGIFERVLGKKSSTGKDKITRLNTAGPANMFNKEGIPEMQKYVDENTGRIFKTNFEYYIGKR